MPKNKSSMTTPKGLYSTPDNPMAQARQVSSKAGPGSNADQAKVNSLMQKAHAEKESLRGKSGM